MEREIYAAYQENVASGMTDREARFALVERFGNSRENDNYAALVDRLEAEGYYDDEADPLDRLDDENLYPWASMDFRG